MNTLFDIPTTSVPTLPPLPKATCRTCIFRFRAKTDDHSTKWEQYCEKRPPKRKNTVGRLKIKVTNTACGYYTVSKKNIKENES